MEKRRTATSNSRVDLLSYATGVNALPLHAQQELIHIDKAVIIAAVWQSLWPDCPSRET
jgi:hypothetical protein